MIRTLMGVVVGLVVAGMVTASNASVITFDEPTNPLNILSPNTTGAGVFFETQGFQFQLGQDNTGLISDGSTCSPACPSNGTNYLFSQDSGRFTAISMTAVSGAAFNPSSVDLAKSFEGVQFEATTITATGYFSDGSLTSTVFLIDGINDGAGGLSDFQNFLFPNAFNNIVQLDFNGSGGIYNGPTFFGKISQLITFHWFPSPSQPQHGSSSPGWAWLVRWLGNGEKLCK